MAREMSLTEVAKYHRIGWNQAWRMELEYMRELVKKRPPALKIRVIGVEAKPGLPAPMTISPKIMDDVDKFWSSQRVSPQDIVLGVNVNASDLAYCRRWRPESGTVHRGDVTV